MNALRFAAGLAAMAILGACAAPSSQRAYTYNAYGPAPGPAPQFNQPVYPDASQGAYPAMPAYPDDPYFARRGDPPRYAQAPDNRTYDAYPGRETYDVRPPYRADGGPRYVRPQAPREYSYTDDRGSSRFRDGAKERYRAGVYAEGRPAPPGPSPSYAAAPEPRVLPSVPPPSYAEPRYQQPPPRPYVERRPLPFYAERAMERREADMRQRLAQSPVGVRREGRNLQLQMRNDVLFAFDSAALRPQARTLIRTIADDLRRYPEIVLVNGYTDRSGPAAYNLRLSQARARAVADELARDGVDRRRITARGFGETNLRVQTADGVYEPRNRRVEIVFQPPMS